MGLRIVLWQEDSTIENVVDRKKKILSEVGLNFIKVGYFHNIVARRERHGLGNFLGVGM